jgi:hypothetical protein
MMLPFAPLAAAAACRSKAPRILCVNFLLDSESIPAARHIRYFHDRIWREACEDLAKLGISVEMVTGRGCVHRPPDRAPVFEGLIRGAINIVLTRTVPMHWDRCRGMKGLAFRAGGYDVCLLALDHAHAFRFPYLATNSCLHELLHFLLGDVDAKKPGGLAGEWREFCVDALATHLRFRRSRAVASGNHNA